MKFHDYFESIKKKPVTFRKNPTEYIIDGGGTWWALYRKIEGCHKCEDHYLKVGLFANTFSSSECICHYDALGKTMAIKVKIDDFKLLQ